MDGNALPVSTLDLYARLGTAPAPVLVDVRHSDAFDADDELIIGAMRHDPDHNRSLRDLSAGRPVVVYCVHGHEVSQSAAALFRSAGIQAAYLEGGITGWRAHHLPTRRKSSVFVDKWVTREHPNIDRIACPWLVLRFINPNAEFLYAPSADVSEVARTQKATPYDIMNVEFGHVGDRCSFDAIVRHFGIHDPALDQTATIVRGADTSRSDLAPQCEGLLAVSYGLSANFPDDHQMLKHGLVIYDALYTWCRQQQETVRQPVGARA